MLVWASRGVAAGAGLDSTRVGGANTTAVLEMVAEDGNAAVTATPAGKREATGLPFCPILRRTGANARLADHPEIDQCGIANSGSSKSMDDDSVNNTPYNIQAVEKEEIPAEAFTEAPGSLALLVLLGAAAGTVMGAGVAVDCSVAGANGADGVGSV